MCCYLEIGSWQLQLVKMKYIYICTLRQHDWHSYGEGNFWSHSHSGRRTHEQQGGDESCVSTSQGTPKLASQPPTRGEAGGHAPCCPLIFDSITKITNSDHQVTLQTFAAAVLGSTWSGLCPRGHLWHRQRAQNAPGVQVVRFAGGYKLSDATDIVNTRRFGGCPLVTSCFPWLGLLPSFLVSPQPL